MDWWVVLSNICVRGCGTGINFVGEEVLDQSWVDSTSRRKKSKDHSAPSITLKEFTTIVLYLYIRASQPYITFGHVNWHFVIAPNYKVYS